MLRIFDTISADRLRKLLSQYSEAFHITIYILDCSKILLLKYPDYSLQEEIIRKPLHLRDSLLGYVAVPSADKEAETHLSFIEQNLSEMIEMGYELDSLSGEVVRNYEELTLLWNISSRLGSELNVDKICKILSGESMNICPSKNISIMLDGELFSDAVTMTSCLPNVFPGPDWETATPESQGVDSAKLEQALQFLKANAGSNGVRELVIIRNGRMIWQGDNIDHRHGVWSCTKSFTSRSIRIRGLIPKAVARRKLMLFSRCKIASSACTFSTGRPLASR